MTTLDRRPLGDDDREQQQEDPKWVLHETDQLRRSAFLGVAIGTAAVLTAVIAVPMLYNYMQYVQSSLQEELAFCHHRTEGLWDEYAKVRERS